MNDALLRVQELSILLNNRKTLVKKISFAVSAGETLAIVGESGSGKSLTALAIMQLLPLGLTIDKSSSIFLQHQDLLTLSELQMRHIRGRKIALVFQEAIAALNPVMTIGDQIMEVLKFHFKLSRQQRRLKALALLTEVGMPEPNYYLNVYPHQLSGGLKQRAMIAIALAGEPMILIADEPTTALDVTLQAQILTLLKTIQEKRGMGLIFITHDLGVVYEVADDVIVLQKGEVVEAASAEDFFNAPTHPYSQKLFSSLPGFLKPLPKNEQPTKTLLAVDQLKVYYPIKKGIFKRTVGFIKAVDGINLAVQEGKTLALVGESGSGKTTTGMAILKLAPLTAGRISFGGLDLSRLTPRELKHFRHHLQVVFQDPYGSMNPRMLVGDIIAEGMRLYKVKNIDQRVDYLLDCVGLETDSKLRYPHEFSGGQRQRICIARALAVEPRLLICDEPTSALDVSAQMQVLSLLARLQQEMGLAYLLITHNIAVVDYMADEVAVMHQGKVVESGPTDKVLHHPQHPYTQKLLSAVPTVPLTKSLTLRNKN